VKATSPGEDAVMFADRKDAGRKLAEKLLWVKDMAKDNVANNVIVLAIPRGGVVIGDIIASRLRSKLDIVVSRKIGAPFNPELAIGAVMPDGACFLNVGTAEALQVPEQYIATQAEEQMKEINRRLMLYRGRKKYDNELEGKIVILVDDGIATGSTIFAASQWVKAQKCRQIIIAIPVGPKHTVDKLKEVADIVVVIDAPTSFQAVGEFYQDFSQITDEEVLDIMRRHGYNNTIDHYDESLVE
jgi:putative phosphoribosyl transferase